MWGKHYVRRKLVTLNYLLNKSRKKKTQNSCVQDTNGAKKKKYQLNSCIFSNYQVLASDDNVHDASR